MAKNLREGKSPLDPGPPGREEVPLADFVPIVPDHELIRRIGGGSYGEVWLARNVVGTYRAVKVVYRKTFEHDRPYEREFGGMQKFEPVSRTHEGLVNVLQIGRNDQAGYFYYIMELADGEEMQNEKGKMKNESAANPTASDRQQSILNFEFYILNYRPCTLDRLLRPNSQLSTPNPQPATHRLPVAECVRIGLTLTSALAHLHKHGLVHRDIKPSNILIINGVPKLADIGLVADMSDARSYVGTEGFIPPEGPGKPQADLYSLGKVLYEISTGKDRHDFPDLPPDLRDSAEQSGFSELNEIILKACASEVAHRYRSAEEMHADLALLQRGSSVRQKNATQRHLVAVKKISLTTAVFALVLATVWFAVDRLSQQSNHTSKGQLSKSWKPSPEAKKLYQEGSEHMRKQTKDGIAQAISCLNRAIELDPNYALAYCRLAEANMIASELVIPPVQALAEMRSKARRAVEIDDNLPDGHMYLGLALIQDFDIAGGEVELKRAVELGPNHAWPHNFYAGLLRCTGRVKEAGEHQRKARQLDPTDPQLLVWECRQLCSERRFEEALRLAQDQTLLTSNLVLRPIILSDVYIGCQRFEEAVTELNKVRAMDNDPGTIASLGYVYGRLGRTNEARAWFQELEHMRSNRHVSAYARAWVHAGLGETNEAIRELQLAYEERSPALLTLKIDWRWDGLRSDPRFVELLKSVGLEK